MLNRMPTCHAANVLRMSTEKPLAVALYSPLQKNNLETFGRVPGQDIVFKHAFSQIPNVQTKQPIDFL